MQSETNLLSVQGLLWTGSGAVCDFFFDHEGVGRVFRKSYTKESAFTKGRHSLLALYDTLRAGRRLGADQVQSLRWFLKGDPSASQEPLQGRELRNLQRNAMVRRELGPAYGEAVDCLDTRLNDILGLGTNAAQRKAFKAAVETFYNQFKQLVPDRNFLGPRRYVVLNNDPHGATIRFINCVPATNVFLVIRNPSDTFANVVMRKRFKAEVDSASDFARRFNSKVHSIIGDFHEDGLGDAVFRAVVFEELVTHPDKYESLLRRFVDLGERRSKRFDPSLSIKKVGLAASLPAKVREHVETRTSARWRELLAFLRDNRLMIDD